MSSWSTGGDDALHEMAVEYAMLAVPGHQSGKFQDDDAERQQKIIKSLMVARFGDYKTQEAIKQAQETLKMVDFHEPEQLPYQQWWGEFLGKVTK